jgi:eukaryotic-like serine/threonine-protein kinase
MGMGYHPAGMELYPGAVVAGRYRVDRKIGSGGMGEVWAGEHVAVGVRVAVKTLLPAAALDQQLVARFRREAQLLGRMRSDRVSRVVDFIEDRAFGLVLVMDFVDGELLGHVLSSRRLGVEEAIDLGVDIVTALSDLHHVKVVHRDLKPDNIILEPLRGGRARAVIVDLGLGRIEVDIEDPTSGITHVDMAIGTLPYMAPEQIMSSRTVTGVADLYAVGAILFRAVSGRQVFGEADDVAAARRKIAGEAPPLDLQRMDRVAKGFAAVVARALRRLPEQRYASAEEMLADLTALQDLARAMSFDLDAATEVAPSSLIQATTSTSDGPSEPTQLMARPSLGHAFFDEATQLAESATELAPPSVKLSPPSVRVSQGGPLPDLSRNSTAAPPPPVVAPAPAPVALPVAVPAVAAPPVATPWTISLRTAVVGLVAALAVGAALGFEAHRLVGP